MSLEQKGSAMAEYVLSIPRARVPAIDERNTGTSGLTQAVAFAPSLRYVQYLPTRDVKG